MVLKDNKQKNTKIDYLETPITVKITPEINEMIQYISSETTLNASSIVRYGIRLLYKKIKKEWYNE